MLEKDVIIFVRGEQYYEGVDPDGIELATEGTLVIGDDGVIELTYQETELTGMEGTETRFTIEKERVMLTRSGSVSSQMVFQPGVQHTSMYATPWGNLLVDINTSKLSHRLGEHGGLLHIQYTISVGHQVTGKNQFKIRVREKMR